MRESRIAHTAVRGSGPGLLVRLERGQRFAGLAVAVRCSAEPAGGAVKIAVLAQDDAEIALGRGVVGLGRPVEPVNRGLWVVALAPEQASQRVCALGVGRGAVQRRLGGVDLAPFPEQHAQPVRGAGVTQFHGGSQPAFGGGEVRLAQALPERERGGAVAGSGGRLELWCSSGTAPTPLVPGRRRAASSARSASMRLRTVVRFRCLRSYASILASSLRESPVSLPVISSAVSVS